MASVSKPCFLNSSVMSSSSLPVEDASEESDDFKVPFKVGAFNDMITPVVWEGRPFHRPNSRRALVLSVRRGETNYPPSCSLPATCRGTIASRCCFRLRNQESRPSKEYHHASSAHSSLRRA